VNSNQFEFRILVDLMEALSRRYSSINMASSTIFFFKRFDIGFAKNGVQWKGES
jgi:hypothetical protein